MKSSSRTKAISDSPWAHLLPVVEDLSARHVAVLMGGVGSERTVSLRSGVEIHKALSQELDNLSAVNVAGEGPGELKRLLQGADTVFIALHGIYGEDGTVQSHLESLGLCYTGSGPAASAAAMDKKVSRQRFMDAGVPVADGFFVPLDKDAFLRRVGDFGVPLVVKPVDSGSSVGITIVKDTDGLAAAYGAAAAETARGIVVERYIQGRELTVGVLLDTALPVVELRPGRDFYDYTAKYSDSATEYVIPAGLPVDLAAAIQTSALEAFRALGCKGFGRVDVMLGDDGYAVLEVNSIPGFTTHSLLPMAASAAGLDLCALCMVILAAAVKG